METGRYSNLITPDRLALLELIKCGLWSHLTPSQEVVSKGDWKGIFNLAIEQTVIGLAWDGLTKLPKEQQPPLKIKLQWYSLVDKIEKSHLALNSVASEVCSLYKEENIGIVMVKGQGVASLYPNPSHRQCGDIDLYVGEENYKRANQIALEKLKPTDLEDTREHSHFTYKDITIEVHHTLMVLYSKSKRENFSNALNSWFPSGVNNIEIGGNMLPTPPEGFNEAYVLLHFYKHLLVYGVGLRQLIDWAFTAQKIDKESIELSEYNGIRKVMSYIAVEYLGFNKDSLPLYTPNVKGGEKLLDTIFIDGNMGHNEIKNGKRRFKWYIAIKLENLTKLLARWFKIYSYLPGDALEYMVGRTWESIIAVLNGEKHYR